jgi:hypothetical protein
MKKIGALLCSAMLVAALPNLAFAANGASPENHSIARDGEITATVDGGNNVTVEVTNSVASNFNANENYALVESFEINGDAADGVSVTIFVGQQYAGHYADVYIQHNDGTFEQFTTSVDSDGTVAFDMNKFSIVTVAVSDQMVEGYTDKPVANTTGKTGTTGTNSTNKTTASTDKSAASPKTGDATAGVAGVTAILAVSACGVAVAYRKKANE